MTENFEIVEDEMDISIFTVRALEDKYDQMESKYNELQNNYNSLENKYLKVLKENDHNKIIVDDLLVKNKIVVDDLLVKNKEIIDSNAAILKDNQRTNNENNKLSYEVYTIYEVMNEEKIKHETVVKNLRTDLENLAIANEMSNQKIIDINYINQQRENNYNFTINKQEDDNYKLIVENCDLQEIIFLYENFVLQSNKDLTQQYMDNLLTLAAKNGNQYIMEFLITNNEDFRYNEELALLNACTYNQYGIVQYLFNIGSDLHINDNIVLKTAIAYGHIGIVDFIYKNKLNGCIDKTFNYESILLYINGFGYTEGHYLTNKLAYINENLVYISENENNLTQILCFTS
jgi:hypothetical protein